MTDQETSDAGPAPGEQWVRRSAGVSVAPFLDGGVAYDAVTERVQVLPASAYWILKESLPWCIDDLVAAASEATGTAVGDVRADIEMLRNLGWLDRTAPARPVLDRVVGSPNVRDGTLGRTLTLLDASVAFRSSDPSVLEAIERFLGWATDDPEPTLIFDVEILADGSVALDTSESWHFPDLATLLARLPWILNQYAIRATDLVVLHAGAVQTPSGEIVVVVGESNAGKSSLVSGLVRAGCDYLGDEAIGVGKDLRAVGYPMPLSLDSAWCAYLGIESSPAGVVGPEKLRPEVVRITKAAGQVSRILAVRHGQEPVVEVRHLIPEDALGVLLDNAMNLGRAGEGGLRTLSALAEKVPVTAVAHCDALEVASAVVSPSGPLGEALGSATHPHVALVESPLNNRSVRRTVGVASLDVIADGQSITIVRHGAARAEILNPSVADVWRRIDGRPTVSELVINAARREGDSLAAAWRRTNEALQHLDDRGLIVVNGPDAKPMNPDDAQSALGEVNERSSEPIHEDTDGWLLGATVAAFDDVVVAVDHPEVGHVLDMAIAAGRATHPHESSGEPGPARTSVRVDLRMLAVEGSGSELTAYGVTQWIPPGDEVQAVAAALVAVSALGLADPSVLLLSTWLCTNGERAALVVGERGTGEDGRSWMHAAMVRVTRGHDVWVVNGEMAAGWLRGSAVGDASLMWHRYRLTLGAVTTDQAGGWKMAVDRSHPNAGFLTPTIHHLSSRSQCGIIVDVDWNVVTGALETEIGMIRTSAARTGADDSSPDRVHLARLEPWSSLGQVRCGPESAKIDARSVEVGRQLYIVDLARTSGRPSDTSLVQALGDLGLDHAEADVVATIAKINGRFLVGHESRVDGSQRTKVYVDTVPQSEWNLLTPRWLPLLGVTEAPAPRWLAYKSDGGVGGRLICTVQFGNLGGATTIGAGIGPILERIPSPWREAVCALMDYGGVDESAIPGIDHSLTVQSDGRRSVDLWLGSTRHTEFERSSEGVMRQLVHAAGHDRADAERLVRWAGRRTIFNLIFGLGSTEQPFVNLYLADFPTMR